MRISQYRKKIEEGINDKKVYRITDDEIIKNLMDLDNEFINSHAKFVSKSYQVENSNRIKEHLLISVLDKEGDAFLAFTLDTKKGKFIHHRSANKVNFEKEQILGDALAKKYDTDGFWY